MNLKDLPKVELHRHLELCVRHSTIKELAPQIGLTLENESDFSDRFLITEPMTNLGAVLGKFMDTQKLWSRLDWIERLSYEAVEDAARENIRLLELRYAPTFIQIGHSHLSFADIHQAIVRGVSKAEGQFNIAVGLIGIIQRISTVEEASQVMEFILNHKETFVGVDLADDEDGFDSKPFAPLFHKAKAAGLGVTVHSGEADLPKAPRYVKDAIDYLGATRIGHGVQIYRDPEIIEYVKSKGVTLELCPTSNWLTQAVASTQTHPFRQLMESGVATTINSDDPGIFNIDLTHEYELLKEQHLFTLEEFKKCNDWAAKASFLPDKKIAQHWDFS